MKYLRFLLLACVSILFTSAVLPGHDAHREASYDVAAVYSIQDLPSDSKVMDRYGNLREARKLLVKTDLHYGDYDVEVKRVEQNFYEVLGTDLYVETKYCYEFSYSDKAVLSITSHYGITIGKLTFLK